MQRSWHAYVANDWRKTDMSSLASPRRPDSPTHCTDDWRWQVADTTGHWTPDIGRGNWVRLRLRPRPKLSFRLRLRLRLRLRPRLTPRLVPRLRLR
eukprot:15438758-Alexandrium_andersonii.AAC.1